MHIELLVIDGCPHAESAHRLLRQACDEVGLGRLPITATVIASDEDARRRRFAGSPSFFADGRDLFADATATPAHACRLYRGATGLSPLPDLVELRQALKQAAGTAAAS
jgi:hypothetical protein